MLGGVSASFSLGLRQIQEGDLACLSLAMTRDDSLGRVQ